MSSFATSPRRMESMLSTLQERRSAWLWFAISLLIVAGSWTGAVVSYRTHLARTGFAPDGIGLLGLMLLAMLLYVPVAVGSFVQAIGAYRSAPRPRGFLQRAELLLLTSPVWVPCLLVLYAVAWFLLLGGPA